MEITVKESKVVKTGTSKSGEWELIRVTSEDNTEYTTFDKKAKNLTGAVIEFEPIIKEGKLSFKEFKVISEAAKSVDGDQMSKGEWADKQRVERTSIENQVRAKLIVELRIAGAFDDKHPIYKKCLAWLDKLEAASQSKATSQKVADASRKPDETPNLEQAEQDTKKLWPEDEAPKTTALAGPITTSQSEPVDEKTGFILTQWLKESLKTLRDKKLISWTESNLLSYMKKWYKIDAQTVMEGAAKLEEGQAAHFVNGIQDALDKLEIQEVPE